MATSQRTLSIFDASIGKKATVALSGLVLFGYVVGHMLGNLQVYFGAEALNGYARSLRASPILLWGVRTLLFVSVVAHVSASMSLVRETAVARPVAYRQKQSLATSYAARSMKYTGPLLFAFILYHLAHLTWPGVSMGAYPHAAHDVYANVVNGFRVPWVSAIYIVAQVLLGLHLYHGSWSLFQSLGLSHPRYNRWREALPRALALAVVVGNISMPVSVLAGIIR